ncbi:MAG: phosphomethylpyrimidine synthase ThiC [Candidatus Micrarchaeota archaeon]
MTKMEEARRGIISKEFRLCSKKEGIPTSKLLRSVSKGRTVIVGKGAKAIAIGELASTKINANLGASHEYSKIKNELAKLQAAIDAGADTIMDLSMARQDEFLSLMTANSSVPVGSVPVYRAFSENDIASVSEDEILNSIKKHIELGVDFATIHSAMLTKGVSFSKRRFMPIVSRGGCFLASWMLHHEKQNPLYKNFDYILELLHASDVAISIGDALRPGCLRDASDKAQLHELKVQGELVKRCHKAGVAAICEGPGHMPISHIEKNVKLQKKLCSNAPYYVLGPLTTDIGAGYDHITSAIGGAIAARAGADFLCVVTPSEHLGLPTCEDIVDGVVAMKLAAHSADIVKFGKRKRDDDLALARSRLDWENQFKLSANPARARHIYATHSTKTGACSMCGKYCAIRIMQKAAKMK